jgi:hypothetical protein
MKNTTICLIGLFLSANSFAQSTVVKSQSKNATPGTSQSSVKKIQKPFNVPTFRIPVGKGDKLENISSKDFNKKIKPVEQVPDFVKNQEIKVTKASPNSKPKVFPPNITNFTAEDIKNDPTLQKGKVFYIKEESKPAISVVDEYNQKRERFLQKRDAAKNIYVEKRQQQIKAQQDAIRQALINEQKRKQLGLPISRLENTKGPNGNEAGITREAMSAMSNGAPLPKVPPTGNIK